MVLVARKAVLTLIDHDHQSLRTLKDLNPRNRIINRHQSAPEQAQDQYGSMFINDCYLCGLPILMMTDHLPLLIK